ncbi:hypothetical protein [Occallatibacter savannae]|uniref:hypothetical protein n=1 Tax=Occallatibacter savannae TaxID=1002691 RepID=UPI000D693DB8|nr:hypothetical protein [Occallatibacter savannae]
MLNWKTLGVVALLGAGLVVTGCKSAPELSKDQALKMVQDKYDQTAPVGVNVLVDDAGMRQGATAKLWDRTKVFPNKLWADFKLTPDGKKAVVLPGGGDTIEWRPASLEDKTYTIVVTTTAANHLKAKDMGDLQDEMLAGADTAKAGRYTEVQNLTGVPQTLQDIIAHNPQNKVSSKREADFALVNGSWTLKAIR